MTEDEIQASLARVRAANIARSRKKAESRRARLLRGGDYALIRRMLDRAERRAKEFGREFSITENDLAIPDECPVFRVPLVPGHRDWTPSIDRIDNRKGYVPGNVRVISNRANNVKSDATLAEIEAVYLYMKRERFGLG